MTVTESHQVRAMTRDRHLSDSESYRSQRGCVKYVVPVNKKELKFKDFILVCNEMLKLKFWFHFLRAHECCRQSVYVHTVLFINNAQQ